MTNEANPRSVLTRNASGAPVVFNRVKRITSHVGLSRYMAELVTTGMEIARVAEIPSPYAFSSTHTVYHVVEEDGSDVIIIETAHKRYDVFAVPATAVQFPAEVA